MPITINVNEKKIAGNKLVQSLINRLKAEYENLNLTNSNIYYDFPVYKDLDGEVIVAQLLAISDMHGVVLFQISDKIKIEDFSLTYELYVEDIENLYSTIFTRLMRNKNLRKDKSSLIVPINTIIYCPLLESPFEDKSDVLIANSWQQIQDFFQNKIANNGLNIYKELKSSIEGSKGLIIPNKRDNVLKNTKGDIINDLEREIASFDEFQKNAYMSVLTGASRIRGLAGSGKTVVLAMKAAITHLRNPQAKIAYTFYTKSLNQHIKRLITRFYRQFDDKDPNWENLEILHAWGSSYNPGIYYNACKANNVIPLNFTDASKQSRNAFEYCCMNLMNNKLFSIYDYIFIDEGQDFPQSFLKLCSQITKNNKLSWAYDELQTIFKIQIPTPKEIFGINERGESIVELEEDIILFKCYRNPREILVIAHALGFGIYGNIVQMIDNKEYWSDIGYVWELGNFIQNEDTILVRPEENSLKSISDKFDIDAIVRTLTCESINDEVVKVASLINEDINQGLLPEDILVITVDDRYANNYLEGIQGILANQYSISSNNIHADKFTIKDFQIKGCVTLSTVYKAKGNEAYSVYILGVDSLFSLKPEIKERNIIFTAMTRSKSWVHISGVGKSAELCFLEIKKAKDNFPKLVFPFPDINALKLMIRDIDDRAIRKSKVAKTIDDLLDQLTPDEIVRYLESLKKGKKI